MGRGLTNPVQSTGNSLTSVAPSNNSQSSDDSDRKFDYSKPTPDQDLEKSINGMNLYESIEYWFTRWWWKIHVDNTLANHETRIQRLEAMAHWPC